jgi:hypothetical protein
MDGFTESGDLEKEVQPLDIEFINKAKNELTRDFFEQELTRKFL